MCRCIFDQDLPGERLNRWEVCVVLKQWGAVQSRINIWLFLDGIVFLMCIEIDRHEWIGRFGFQAVVGTSELEPLLEGNSMYKQRRPDLCCTMSQSDVGKQTINFLAWSIPIAHPACFCLPPAHPEIFRVQHFHVFSTCSWVPHWLTRGWVRSYP